MKYKRLGDYIQLVDNRNTDGKIKNLLGINITNNFMPTVANKSGLDLTKYKIVSRGVFATNIMHVGRDERLPIALYEDNEPALISPAYKTFKVIDENKLIPEYLMIEFHRHEFHRLAWFFCDSSIRGGLDWDRFCEIKIPIPDIEEQKKYVDIYNGLLNNQKAYEKSLDDLQLICDTKIQDLINKGELKPLGDYIQQSDERNTDLKIDNLLGISVNKVFIPSKSNKTNLNLLNYKVVRPKQFAYVTVTSRNGEKISIALLDGEPGLVSATYIVFEVSDENVLLPEYLYLYFQRPEFDRYARFHSWGSARETFDWNEMCRVEIPVPDIEVQKAIVTIYHTLQTRKRINEQLKDMIKPLCPVLMKGVMDEIVEQEREEAMV